MGKNKSAAQTQAADTPHPAEKERQRHSRQRTPKKEILQISLEPQTFDASLNTINPSNFFRKFSEADEPKFVELRRKCYVQHYMWLKECAQSHLQSYHVDTSSMLNSFISDCQRDWPSLRQLLPVAMVHIGTNFV